MYKIRCNAYEVYNVLWITHANPENVLREKTKRRCECISSYVTQVMHQYKMWTPLGLLLH